MRSMSRMVLVALVAAFALSAVAASSAFASPEWYAKKGGVWAKVTTSLKVKATITFEATDTGYKGLFGKSRTVRCEGAPEGEIKSGGIGDIYAMNAKGCEAVSVCENVEHWSFENIPWGTELYSSGSEVRDRIVDGSSGKRPAWNMECKIALLGSEVDECGLNTSTHITNNASGYVEAAFDSKSNKTVCSQFSKEETGEWKGVFKIKPTESGVEAIKVE